MVSKWYHLSNFASRISARVSAQLRVYAPRGETLSIKPRNYCRKVFFQRPILKASVILLIKLTLKDLTFVSLKSFSCELWYHRTYNESVSACVALHWRDSGVCTAGVDFPERLNPFARARDKVPKWPLGSFYGAAEKSACGRARRAYKCAYGRALQHAARVFYRFGRMRVIVCHAAFFPVQLSLSRARIARGSGQVLGSRFPLYVVPPSARAPPRVTRLFDFRLRMPLPLSRRLVVRACTIALLFLCAALLSPHRPPERTPKTAAALGCATLLPLAPFLRRAIGREVYKPARRRRRSEHARESASVWTR